MGIWKMRALALGLFACGASAFASLKPETRRYFEQYTKAAEARMSRDADATHFLELGQTKRQDVFTKEMSDGDKNPPHGQIQHWIGGLFMPGATLQKVRAVMQDYDNYQRIYSPDVTQSKLI